MFKILGYVHIYLTWHAWIRGGNINVQQEWMEEEK
jgi:hypothetical protein